MRQGVRGSLAILLTAALSAAVNLHLLLLLGGGWLGYMVMARRSHVLPVVGNRLMGLRWFFVALVVIHGFGAAWAPENARVDLLLAGARQVAVLMVLVLAVTVVLEPLTIDQRIRAFTRLLRPFRPLGLDPQRVGGMLAVALHEALQLRQTLAADVANESGAQTSRPASGDGRIARIVDQVARHLWQIEHPTTGR